MSSRSAEPRAEPHRLALEPMVTLSVSDLAVARTCGRLFWFGKVEGRSTLPRLAAVRGLGPAVHGLIEAFEAAAPCPPELQAALASRPAAERPGKVGRALCELLYRGFLLPRMLEDQALGEASGELYPAAWDALVAYARALAVLLAENAAAIEPSRVLTRTVIGREVPLRIALPKKVEGLRVELVGRVDAIWFRHKKSHPLLVEFKTRPLDPDGDDLLQLALYQWMLAESNGVEAHAMLVSFAEEEDPIVRGPRELGAIRRGLVSGLVAQAVRWLSWQRAGDPPPPGPADEATCATCPVAAECHLRLGHPFAAPPASRAEEA